jgi:hypothetical protein
MSLPLIVFPLPADSRSPEIRLLISGEMMAFNSAIREIRAKKVFRSFFFPPPVDSRSPEIGCSIFGEMIGSTVPSVKSVPKMSLPLIWIFPAPGG